MKCATCMDIECRCAGCICLVEKDGRWYCDENEDFCGNVEVCGSYDEDTTCILELDE